MGGEGESGEWGSGYAMVGVVYGEERGSVGEEYNSERARRATTTTAATTTCTNRQTESKQSIHRWIS